MGPSKRRWILFCGLAAVGAILGAATGVLVIVLLSAVIARSAPGWFDVRMAAAWGAGLGAVVGPLTLATILRHVPLGRAILVTFSGTLLGALGGWVLSMPHVGAAIGFVAAAAWLRQRDGSAVERTTPPEAPGNAS